MATTLKVICSCIPGFEKVAIAECKERLSLDAESDLRGRIYFSISLEDLLRLTELRSVHHYWVVVREFKECWDQEIDQNSAEILKLLCSHADTIDWKDALHAWKVFKAFHGRKKVLPDSSIPEKRLKTDCNSESDNVESELNSNLNGAHTSDPSRTFNFDSDIPELAAEKLAFRVTCSRSGKHPFGSMEAAKEIGSTVNERFFWRVDLTKFDVEVVVHIVDRDVTFGIQLTHESQSLRNITHFGPTTLKANISYCMLRLADLQPGDIVLDPMCGGGSISLEASACFPSTFQSLGDNHPEAVLNAAGNFEAVQSKRNPQEAHCSSRTLPYSVSRWDVYHLPIRTESIDVIVSDLPFGKKMGNKQRNLFLYPNALAEMGRVCKPAGRAVLLTQHKQAMWRALDRCKMFKVKSIHTINMGGMNVCVYVLGRIATSVLTDEKTKKTEDGNVKSTNVKEAESSS